MENGRNEIGGRQLVAGYLGVVLMLIGGDFLLPLAAPPPFLGGGFIGRDFCGSRVGGGFFLDCM